MTASRYIAGRSEVLRPAPMNAADLQAHESAVAEFMRQAAENDPEFTAAVCRRHLVLSEDALRYRRGREESLSAQRAERILHAGLDGRRVD
jgi:predicted HAD superfamily Cof-like phosphohydrolase